MTNAFARLTPQQWMLRLVVVLGPLLALVAGAATGARLPAFVVVLVAVMAISAAARPRSHAGAVSLLLVVTWWWVADAGDGVVVMLAALGLTAAHVAGVLTAYGPGRLDLDPRLVRRWWARGGLMLGAAVLAWAAAHLLERAPDTSSVVLVTGLVLVAVVAWWMYARTGDRA